jgi:cyclopropane fatty-acyl-phospholipid synthase-like methyltransferase
LRIEIVKQEIIAKFFLTKKINGLTAWALLVAQIIPKKRANDSTDNEPDQWLKEIYFPGRYVFSYTYIDFESLNLTLSKPIKKPESYFQK